MKPVFRLCPTVLVAAIVWYHSTQKVLSQAPDAKSPAAVGPALQHLDDLVRLYQTEDRNLSSFYDLPWAAGRFDRMEQLFRGWQERLSKVDFAALDEPGRIDYLLLRNKLNFELSRLALARRRLAEIEQLVPFRTALQDLERARWRMEPVDAPAAATVVASWPEQIKKLRERLDKSRKAKDKDTQGVAPASAPDKSGIAAGTNAPKTEAGTNEPPPLSVSPLLAWRTAGVVEDLLSTLKRWFSFYDGYQPDFTWWLRKPHEEAAKALEDYQKYLREEVAGLKGKDEDPLIGEPLGVEALAGDLANEMIAYTPQELIALGERQLAWCEAEMKKASAEMGFGDDWKAALAKVKGDYMPPGKQDTLVADLAREAIQFVKQHDLVTVPALCEETWRLTMLSPEGQKTLPYAAYGGQNMQVAYAKEEMKNQDKLESMRGNNRHFSRIVAPHELIPGHHLQLFTAQRERPYRSLFSTPFLVEGWALYWEMRLWDLGYGKTPEDRIGMLFWRMHRAARIIVSLKFHLGEMTPAEMVNFLVERVGHEKLGATSEVRRFIGDGYSPLYQCGYMIGGLQILALHHELVDSGKMREKQFNDTVLTYNAIPVDLIRAGMLHLLLRPDQRAEWKAF
jgi:hypothetical protein